MCCEGGATILAEVEARPGKSPAFGGTYPQERAAKERTGALQRKCEKSYNGLGLFSFISICWS